MAPILLATGGQRGHHRPLWLHASEPLTGSPAPTQDIASRILGYEELIDAGSQGWAVANERTAIRS